MSVNEKTLCHFAVHLPLAKGPSLSVIWQVTESIRGHTHLPEILDVKENRAQRLIFGLERIKFVKLLKRSKERVKVVFKGLVSTLIILFYAFVTE